MENKEFDMYVWTPLPKEAIPDELFHFLRVIEHGASKYAMNNWLEPNGKNCDHKSMYASIFRHVADAYANKKEDRDSKIDPRLHAACRLLFDYVRECKGLIHENDSTN